MSRLALSIAINNITYLQNIEYGLFEKQENSASPLGMIHGSASNAILKCINELEELIKLEKENIINAYNQGRHDCFHEKPIKKYNAKKYYKQLRIYDHNRKF